MYPPVSQLAVRVRPLDLADSIGKAAELIRSSNGRAAPVTLSGHVVGMISAQDVAAVVAADPEKARALPVATLTLTPCYGIPDFWSADRALAHFRREGLEASPVLDAMGRYLGMVTMADLTSALCGRLRPRSIGGMATPYGVYLTDGTVRGGVGNWGLVSAGIFMGLLHLAAVMLTYAALGDTGWITRFPAAFAWLHRLGAEEVRNAIVLLLFALGFRLSPISGYHAAEHQVVHAIEAGDDLRPDVVRGKPRVHPRCGTNLVVGLYLILFLWNCEPLRQWQSLGAMAGLVLFLFTWRRLGSAAQQYVTTRPASEEEIKSGIRAGEELLREFQNHRAARQSRWLRLWNIGICQVFGGFAALMLAIWLISLVVPLPGIDLLW